MATSLLTSIMRTVTDLTGSANEQSEQEDETDANIPPEIAEHEEAEDNGSTDSMPRPPEIASPEPPEFDRATTTNSEFDTITPRASNVNTPRAGNSPEPASISTMTSMTHQDVKEEEDISTNQKMDVSESKVSEQIITSTFDTVPKGPSLPALEEDSGDQIDSGDTRKVRKRKRKRSGEDGGQSAKKRRKSVEQELEESQGNFRVKSIEGWRLSDGQTKFNVKWEGYSDEEPTLEPMENLAGKFPNVVFKQWQHEALTALHNHDESGLIQMIDRMSPAQLKKLLQDKYEDGDDYNKLALRELFKMNGDDDEKLRLNHTQ